MAIEQDLEEALDAAQLAILHRIKDAVVHGASGGAVRDYAEAYAWLVYPGEAHGPSVNISK